ncbi:MAG: DAK2 domain-containing protein, partial [Arachnia sp.]
GTAALDDTTRRAAMAPALAAWDQALDEGLSLSQVAAAAAEAARQGRDHTLELVARKGRASYLGERSQGHQDPGATSTAYLFEALAAVVEEV